MFDFGSGELLVIGVVALVVIGPKELPGLLRTVGQTVARFRRMAGDFQGQFQSALREAELHDAVKSISDIQSSVSGATSFDDPNLGLPAPPVPSHLMPPVELQSPAAVEKRPAADPVVDAKPTSPSTPEPSADAKPKKPRAKKAKPVVEPAPKEDAQAALFDSLPAPADTASRAPETVAKPRKPRAVKSKSGTEIPGPDDQAKPEPKPAKRVTRKPKTGEETV